MPTPTPIPLDSLLYYDLGQLKKITSDNTVAITQGFTAGSLTTLGTVSGASGTFSGNVAITGNLTVGGKVTSADRVNVALGDSYIDLLASNTVTGSAAAGGLTVNIEAQTSTFSATAFTAGVVTTGPQPYITVSTNPIGLLDPNDIIQVSGTKNGQNDGLYVVESVTTTQIRIKGIGTIPVSAQTPFIQNDFTTTTGETTAVVVGAKVAVWTVSNGALFKTGPAAIAAGTWAYHTGTTDAAFINSWSALTAVTVSLQAAYDGGATIQLAGGTDLVVSAPLSGFAAITLGANKASSITVTGDTFALSATRIDLNGGNVNFAKAGTIAVTTTGTAAGDVVYFGSPFAAQLSDNNGATDALNVDGVVADAGYVATVQGTRVFVRFLSIETPTAGQTAWLSSTAGQATVNLPASPARIYRLGRVTGVNAGGLYEVVWNPQYIADV